MTIIALYIKFTTTLTLWVNNCYYQWIFYEFPSMNENGLSSRKLSCSKLLASKVMVKFSDSWIILRQGKKIIIPFDFFLFCFKFCCSGGYENMTSIDLNVFAYLVPVDLFLRDDWMDFPTSENLFQPSGFSHLTKIKFTLVSCANAPDSTNVSKLNHWMHDRHFVRLDSFPHAEDNI